MRPDLDERVTHAHGTAGGPPGADIQWETYRAADGHRYLARYGPGGITVRHHTDPDGMSTGVEIETDGPRGCYVIVSDTQARWLARHGIPLALGDHPEPRQAEDAQAWRDPRQSGIITRLWLALTARRP